ncbi:MAG: hypothetical protein K6E50_11445 [Lachnospiraceae bacterium]|nr:hypothetical protein [Lachnospiraceae bacterium]
MKKRRKGLLAWFRKGSAGVTVFEVMIALALFAVIITPVMRSFVTAIQVNKRGRDVMVATDVANSIMEGIKSKTYEEVVMALCAAPTGFTTSVGDESSSAKLALSSINDNWYNMGHVGGIDPGKKILESGAPMTTRNFHGDFESTYISVGADDCHKRTAAETEDQVMAGKAIQDLKLGFDPTMTYEDYMKTNFDKLLYFGFTGNVQFADPTHSSGKGVPKTTYMLYSRIQKDNRFYDATVTFLPRSHTQNNGKAEMRRPVGGGSYEAADTYFTYEVIVKVYEYHYDPAKKLWVGRFAEDGSNTFQDPPIAELHSGILNKSINK